MRTIERLASWELSRQFFALLIVALVTGAPRLFAAELTLAELRTIQEQMKSYDVLTVDFTQKTETPLSKVRGKAPRREGHAVLTKPDRFKWMLETPTKDYKLYDGTYFYELDPDSNTAKRYSLTGPQSYEIRQVVDMVMNFDTLLRRYDLKKAERDGDVVNVYLTPKSVQEITEIQLHVSVKDSFVSYLKWETKAKTTMTLEFRNPVRKHVPDSFYVLPAGVKVTDSN